MTEEEDIVFAEEETTVEAAATEPVWRILVVDDDQGVHEATEFALAGVRILGRHLQLLHAHSGAEALAVLRAEPDMAVILLDVVMESDDAGLKTVDAIRNEIKAVNTRIILRTGQPGHAPETDTITRYDINDYKTKGELTRNKLFTSLTAAIRSYDQLLRMESSRRGLEKIISASNQFIAEQGMQSFAEGVITQIASLIGVSPEGLVCAAAEEPRGDFGPRQYRVIAAAGRFRHMMQQRLSELEDRRIAHALADVLVRRHSVVNPHSVVLYFRKSEREGFAAFVDSVAPIAEVDRHLLSVFCTNIALCAKNVDLVSELRRDAFVDRLTELPNRTAFIGQLSVHARQPGRIPMVLAVIDVDQFAAVNDMLGNSYGDELLRAMAHRLRAAFVADAFIARLEGDAFGLLGPPDRLNPETLRRCFAEPFAIQDVRHPVSVCAGFVPLEMPYREGAEYLKDGYLALKRAKSAGMGQTVTYSRDIGAESRERATMLRDLRTSFDSRQLHLVYQPLLELGSRRLVGVEALMRWRREDGRLVPPDRFIPVAEQSGLIMNLGAWLLEESFAALGRFQAAGLPDLRMAVNISPVQLRQPGFLETVHQALATTGADPRRLEFEVTESVAVGGLDVVMEVLGALRDLGIAVAIDDFGTGYSSLSYLERLPASRLKIDRSFVRAMAQEGQGRRIARTIILLARELGLRVVAEGVDNPAVLPLLEQFGCDEVQGFHFAEPMREESLLAWQAGRAS
ncbi:MAG TPA: EAL domain-containing protein [Rhodocyclaceae bacterium]|nr:EAL domain-containing protein [Rhodocyclaceae bacterium]